MPKPLPVVEEPEVAEVEVSDEADQKKTFAGFVYETGQDLGSVSDGHEARSGAGPNPFYRGRASGQRGGGGCGAKQGRDFGSG